MCLANISPTTKNPPMVRNCRANNSTSTVETLGLVQWWAYQHANNNALPTTHTITQSRPNDCLLSGLFDSFLVYFYWNVNIQHERRCSTHHDKILYRCCMKNRWDKVIQLRKNKPLKLMFSLDFFKIWVLKAKYC